VEENQLAIRMPQGVLYLRFFCDLEGVKKGPTQSHGRNTEVGMVPYGWLQELGKDRCKSWHQANIISDKLCTSLLLFFKYCYKSLLSEEYINLIEKVYHGNIVIVQGIVELQSKP
jgi:hypothetical protein